MKDKILSTAHGAYEMQVWDGVNTSGIRPVGDKVLVMVDPAVERLGSIIITSDIAERQTLASTTGVVIALGQTAFAWDGARLVEWDGEKPTEGDRVFFQRFAGQEYTGLDGLLYRLLEDRSIAGIEAVQRLGHAASGVPVPDKATRARKKAA